MEGETAWHVAFALYHKRIENGSESQTRHDWQRRPGVTSATTDLEMVDLSRTMSAPSAHWTRTRWSPSPAAKKLGLRHLWGELGWASFTYLLLLLTATAKRRPINHPWAVRFFVSHTRKKSDACKRVSVACLFGRQNAKSFGSGLGTAAFGPPGVEALTTTIIQA